MKRLFKKMMAGLIIAIASNVAFALDCSFTTDTLGEVCFKHSGHSVSATAKHLHAGKIVDGIQLVIYACDEEYCRFAMRDVAHTPVVRGSAIPDIIYVPGSGKSVSVSGNHYYTACVIYAQNKRPGVCADGVFIK